MGASRVVAVASRSQSDSGFEGGGKLMAREMKIGGADNGRCTAEVAGRWAEHRKAGRRMEMER